MNTSYVINRGKVLGLEREFFKYHEIISSHSSILETMTDVILLMEDDIIQRYGMESYGVFRRNYWTWKKRFLK